MTLLELEHEMAASLRPHADMARIRWRTRSRRVFASSMRASLSLM